LLQKESGELEEAVEKKCKAKHNVEESEYNFSSLTKRNQPHGAEYFITDTRVSSKPHSFRRFVILVTKSKLLDLLM
jgi:hypothetical protein